MISGILFGSLAVFFILNVPIAVALGIAALVTILFTGNMSATYIAQNLITNTDSFPIMAIPFFILAGELMGGGGISRRLLNVSNIFFGNITGGLAIVAVVVSMFFAAISGSGPATVAAVGSMVVPTMLKKGYDKGFTLALVACAGSIGVIIPPSIPMVIYSLSANTSVTKLFMAGFIPGILIGTILILYAYFYSKVKGYTGDGIVYTTKESHSIIWEAKWALIVPVIILGGIYGGVFTPTEAAAVAVIYSFIIGVFVYKELSWKELYNVIKNASLTTGTIIIILGCATAFTRVLTIEQIPSVVTAWIISITDNPVLILIIMNIILLFVGCFMETLVSIMILTPLFLPIAIRVGIDPIHFGIIMIVNLAIGFITPPLGVNLFIAARVGEVKIEVVLKGIVQFIILMIIALVLITYIPAISLFLPNLLFQ